MNKAYLEITMQVPAKLTPRRSRLLDIQGFDTIDEQVLALIDAAVATSKAAPPPAESEVVTDVYISY